LGLDKLAWLLPPLLLLAWLFFMRGQTSDSSPEPATIQRQPSASPSPSPVASWRAFANRDFRQLFTVFLLNGIASALPASLLLFFAQDVLRANEAQTSLFLLLYFVGSAVSIPLWLRVVRLAGLARSWLIGMLLAVVIFVATLALAAGDTAWFAGICCLSGLALGIDLIAPAAMLAGISQSNTDKEQSGLYFGWWHFASKLNLALAAGLALPILSLLGYVPGLSGGQALGPLHWAYAGLPCLLKSVAAGALWLYFLRPNERMMQLSALNTQSGDIT
jgi:glycoside/pentoside/hexuronide:cation symporter, GPH family